MNDAIDILTLASELPRRRACRALIVLTEDAGGQQEWAGRLAERAGGRHLDVLDRFVQDEKLSSRISTFGVNDLFSLLSTEDGKLVVATGFEFLRASWVARSGAMTDFAKQAEFWSKSPSLILVTQKDATLPKLGASKRFQYTYVVDQRDTLAL